MLTIILGGRTTLSVTDAFELRTCAKNGVEETHLVDVSESISKKVLNRDRHADPVLCDFMRLIEKLEMAKSIPTDSDTRRPLEACSTKRA